MCLVYNIKVVLPLDYSLSLDTNKKIFSTLPFACCLHVEMNIHNVDILVIQSFMPTLSTDKYNDFIDANRIEDAEDRLKTMKKLVCVKGKQNMFDEYVSHKI